jgi:hypothetical protein
MTLGWPTPVWSWHSRPRGRWLSPAAKAPSGPEPAGTSARGVLSPFLRQRLTMHVSRHRHGDLGTLAPAERTRPARLDRPAATGAGQRPAPFGFYARDPDTGSFYTVGLMVLTLSGPRSPP